MLNTAAFALVLLLLDSVAANWLSNELRQLKQDVQAQIKGEEFIRDRLANTITRLDFNCGGLNMPACEVVTPAGSFPRNCREALSTHVTNNNLWWTIDPDGKNGPIQPFAVKCERSGNDVATKMGFSKSYWARSFDGPYACSDHKDFGVRGNADYCSATKSSVDYILTLEQMRAAIHVSGDCAQRIDWTCLDNSLLYLNPLSSKTMAFGRNLQGFKYFTQGVCECSKDGRCSQTHNLCNCGADYYDWQADTIMIRDKKSLPIAEVILGDLAMKRERARVLVFNVICNDRL